MTALIRASAARAYVIAPAMTSWGLERLLQTGHPHIEVVGASRTAASAAAALGPHACCVVAIAVESDDEIAELVLVQQAVPQARCLVITGSRDAALADRAVLAGARGVVKTCDAPETLLKAVDKVSDGELWLDRRATGRILTEMAQQKANEGRDPEKSRIASLTRRERQMVAAITRDCAAPAKVIAGRLCISERTLRNHLTSIYSKLEVSNRLDLYAFSLRHQIADGR